MTMTTAAPPEHNVTGLDFAERGHLRYAGPPLIDIHSHVMLTQPSDQPNQPPGPLGPEASIAQAETMLKVAQEFNVGRIYTMCPVDHIAPLRARFGERLRFNGSIAKKKIDSPDEDAYRLLDKFLEAGVEIIKFWAAPRGRERGLIVDAPWRVEAARRARAAGIRIVMVHVGDPDTWFRTVYADASKFGTKPQQYEGLERMLEEFPDMTWIGAHMGGDPEHPDHLQALLERYPHYHIDTSATKWVVREVSPRGDAIRDLMCKYPDRFLFGSDLVTRHSLPREHYVSRYWCQRTLWESAWEGPSPIADPDFSANGEDLITPRLQGVDLPEDVLKLVYRENAERILAQSSRH
jgi:predicted TIM-barrel fold metal-dependent hydrolase